MFDLFDKVNDLCPNTSKHLLGRLLIKSKASPAEMSDENSKSYITGRRNISNDV